jgi:hypothetical protein
LFSALFIGALYFGVNSGAIVGQWSGGVVLSAPE